MSQLISDADRAAWRRPKWWRLVIGLVVAAPLPALLIATLGFTHEIWIASAVTTALFYALFATTGIVRMSVPDASGRSNMFRASGFGAFLAIAIGLGFAGLYLLVLTELVLAACAALGIAGLISGALFWLCVYR